MIAPPPIETPRGPLARKFTDAAGKSAGLTAALRETSADLGCHFFDAGGITSASRIDGIHLDADQHLLLGKALAAFVATLPLLDPESAP